MKFYKSLNKQIFRFKKYKIVSIRYEDRLKIMTWRNEQIYHLRQNKLLTKVDQENYFNEVIAKLFEQEQPNQILFSYLENGKCIGYGGLVHINWIDKNAEVSFVMETKLERDYFQIHWCNFLHLIEKVAFQELKLNKIYTYAFDLRPHLYKALEKSNFFNEAHLKEHCFFEGNFIDILVHSKFNIQKDFIDKNKLFLREATLKDVELLFNWVNETNVRYNSLNQELIIWKNHLKWFKSKIEEVNSKLLILMNNTLPLGQIRIDFKENYWVIDYSIDVRFRGNSLGKEIVKLLLQKFKLYNFKAVVKKNNIASVKVFERLGFKKVRIKSVKKEFYEFYYEI